MKLIVAGIKPLTLEFVKEFSQDYEIVVIDSDKSKCEDLYAETGVTVLNNDPTDIGSLEEADISEADSILIHTENDKDNLIIAVLAKKYGVETVASIVKEPKYKELYKTLDVSTVNYTDIILSQLRSTFEELPLVKKSSFGNRGVYKIVVKKGSRIENLRIDELKDKKYFPDNKSIISAVMREEDMIAADNTLRLKEGDEIVLLLESDSVGKLKKLLK